MIKFTSNEIEKYQKLYESFYNDPRILRMKEFRQHRGSNAFEHTLKVARRAYWIAKRWPHKINFDDLLTGAMLHDYCLYDWRETRQSLTHGFRHPKIAMKNAERDFHINKHVSNIIISHMWPLNCFRVHTSREGHIVSIADKIITFKEAFTSTKWKKKHRNEYYPKLLMLEDKKQIDVLPTHCLNLHDEPYKAIEAGYKVIEMRLNDERRKCLKKDDYIQFTNRKTLKKMICQIIDITHYPSFNELYKHYPKEDLGYESNQIANPMDMGKYYSVDEMKKNGVLAIKIRKV